MLRRLAAHFIVVLVICFAAGFAAPAATLSPTLQSKLGNAADSASVGTVIIAFKTTNGLNESQLNILRGVGILKGYSLPQLGMVATVATAGQVRSLAANAAVRSVWSNDRLYYYLHQARVVTGVDKARTDAAFTRSNGGLPVSGAGNFSVVINDSGIDATHNDLKLGTHVVQNVQILTDTDSNNAVISLPESTASFHSRLLRMFPTMTPRWSWHALRWNHWRQWTKSGGTLRRRGARRKIDRVQAREPVSSFLTRSAAFSGPSQIRRYTHSSYLKLVGLSRCI